MQSLQPCSSPLLGVLPSSSRASRPCRALCIGVMWKLFRTGAFMWGWLLAGSQTVDRVAWLICGFGPGLCSQSTAFGLCAGQPATDPGAHPPEVSGVGALATYGGPRPPRRFLCVRPGCCAAYQGAGPPGVSGVGPRPLIGVRAHWGTLGQVPRQLGRLSGRAPTRSFSFGCPVC